MSSTAVNETDETSRIEETTPNFNVTIKDLEVLGALPTGAYYIALRYGNRPLAMVNLTESGTVKSTKNDKGDAFFKVDAVISHTIQSDTILFELYQSHKLLPNEKLGSVPVTMQRLMQSWKTAEKEITEKVASCHCASSRSLVVCIDGTANQFGMKNTNVVELYSRLIKDESQLTYYNSGIGTYVKDSWASPTYWKQVLSHSIDMAIAWNFKRIVLSAYEWLSENYREGDRIFFFGFSRGAYQVRVLAGMIEKVGLLHKGNKDQIPFAYQLYLATTQTNAKQRSDIQDSILNKNLINQKGMKNPEALRKAFKSALSRDDVKVHFVGAWDTVSSIGVVRGPSLPETTTGMKHVCYFRHALALDERRVKFLPEYANGGEGPPIGYNNVKEVWFAGSHSDIGGGNTLNTDLNKFGPALRWMTYEAISCGLKMKAYRGEWEPLEPKESLTPFWWFLEILPVTRLLYKDGERESTRIEMKKKKNTTRRPHFAQSRQVQPGQLIHESVLNNRKPQSYTPKACLHNGIFWEQEILKERKMLELDVYTTATYTLEKLKEKRGILDDLLANTLETLCQNPLGECPEYPCITCSDIWYTFRPKVHN
ncbi:hypothetical protein K435DRAFT_734741 [Dendrothele bispora CBS 962.96]|uniref:T6SS Phospholipase effector Tle1-like catalytic domain-containing protein n=1 Tax=Dendrothele bispora (strain CBS 962.96) TaxID=1314807 RepID=A0A4S8L1W8_DENBC|nr:hypothetical protein K435DRAFT_734741 [Dendrothele bispora CBS 962.96]